MQFSHMQVVGLLNLTQERMMGRSPDLTTLNADHPVDLIVDDSPT